MRMKKCVAVGWKLPGNSSCQTAETELQGLGGFLHDEPILLSKSNKPAGFRIVGLQSFSYQSKLGIVGIKVCANVVSSVEGQIL